MVWLKYEPGTFITVTEKSNRVALWNVSKKNYNDIARFSECPILFCQSLNDPTRIFMTLENGAVAIYDLEKRKTVFNLEPNHSDTIFDLKYSPLLYGVCATCSYDSTIKVWDVTQNKIIYNIDVDFITKNTEKKLNPDLKTSVYSIAWSPIDKDLLISGDASNSLRLWDITKQKMIIYLKLNPNIKESHIIGIDWDEKTNNIISTCLDTVYIISYSNSKLEITKQILINNSIYQIKYNPFNKKEFAVACFDGSIRFFNVDADQPFKTLTGHSKKVFGIFFNKHIKGLMASTSEDFSVGVWDLESSKSTFLKGHKHNTRHAVWLSDIPNILVTGSWDGVIRIWNVDSASCVAEITEHYSDVYGIDISPDHPYLLTSSSRDNSIRFWNLMGFSNKFIDSIINFTNESYVDDIIKKNMDLITRADTISNKFYVKIIKV
jgi:WD40 repeat protein